MIWLAGLEDINLFALEYWVDVWDIFIQDGKDLWEIMNHAFEIWLQYWEKVMLIWSDTIDIAIKEFMSWFNDLDTHDIVLWPTNDGGYWTIGSKKTLPQILLNMKYSTDKVFQTSMDRCVENELSVSVQETHIDVDTIDDLRLMMEKIQDEWLLSALGLE